MDLSNSRRSGAANKSSVVAGSVWESRMKSDEVKGGFKVFNGEYENSNAEEITTTITDGGGNKRLSLKKGQGFGGVGVSGKRKTWKNESFDPKGGRNEDHCKELTVSVVDGIKKSPIRVAKGRSVEHCKDLSLSVDGIKKTVVPGQVKKGKSEGIKELSKSVDGMDQRSPIHMKKPRSEGNSVQLRKVKSDSVKASNQSGNGNGNEGNSLLLRRSKSEENKVVVLGDQKMENNVVPIEENEKNPVETVKDGSESEENCKEFGVCQEKIISSSTSNGNIVKSSPEVLVDDDGVEDDEELYEEEEEEEEAEEEVMVEEEEEEMEVGNEKKSFDIKEMNVPEEKPSKAANEVKKLPEEKPNKAAVYEVKKLQEDKPSKVVNEVKKISQFHNKAAPFSSNVNKQPPPVVKRTTSIYTAPAKSTPNCKSFSV